MGLLTLDITALGVVMTADSKAIEIRDGLTHVGPDAHTVSRDPIAIRRTSDFAGLVGSIGTEGIGRQTTRRFIEDVIASTTEFALPAFCDALANALSDAWVAHGLDSGLWVFVAGTEHAEIRYWHIANCSTGPTGAYYVDVSDTFRAVNDLDEYAVPVACARHQLNTKQELLTRVTLSFRNGVLEPAARVADQFGHVLNPLLDPRTDGFGPPEDLTDFAAIVQMRQEFIKRLFAPKKGLYRGAPAPIQGAIVVKSVDITGAIHEHPIKDPGKPSLVR